MIEHSVLDNGLQVATNRLHGRDSVGLTIWVRVGSRHEAKKVTGVSHFAEHMLFKGTKTRSTRRIKEEIEGIGGSMNAFTGEESTCYFVKIPKIHFRSSFDVLQDMVNESVIKPEEFARERTVILEEIKMYLDLPSQHVHELMSELLWPGEPLGRPIAGSIQTVTDMKRRDLVNHLEAFYHPKNLLVTACGDLSHRDVLRLCESSFGNRKAKAPSRLKKMKTKISSRSKRFHFVEKKTEQTHFVIAFHGLSREDPRRFHLAVLNVLLGANMSSRLFEEVRERRGLAYEIRSSMSFFEGAGNISISAGVEAKKAPQAVRVIMRELQKLKQRGVFEPELRRAKDYFLGQLLLGLEDTLDNSLWFGERVLYGEPAPDVQKIREAIEKVTARDVQNMSKHIFRENGSHFSLIGPSNGVDAEKIKKEFP